MRCDGHATWLANRPVRIAGSEVDACPDLERRAASMHRPTTACPPAGGAPALGRRAHQLRTAAGGLRAVIGAMPEQSSSACGRPARSTNSAADRLFVPSTSEGPGRRGLVKRRPRSRHLPLARRSLVRAPDGADRRGGWRDEPAERTAAAEPVRDVTAAREARRASPADLSHDFGHRSRRLPAITWRGTAVRVLALRRSPLTSAPRRRGSRRRQDPSC
jgi:hypothetical protein